jgi:hypothetical protein
MGLVPLNLFAVMDEIIDFDDELLVFADGQVAEQWLRFYGLCLNLVGQ